MMKNLKNVLPLLFMFVGFIGNAQTELPSFFADDMVLQQNEDVNVWGKDVAGKMVEVSGSWGEKASAKTDDYGKWKVSIKTPAAGGPYALKIKGSDEISLKNILMGEVWLCTGQSNMAMKLKGAGNQPIVGSNEEILNSSNKNLRMFITQINSSNKPLDNVTGEWKISSPATSGEFSATAYFFGKKLNKTLDVPIGLLLTSWGGTRVEYWMDEETLSTFKKVNLPEENPSKPTKGDAMLYNAMIHPFVGYTIKGNIWYQGEGNRREADQYRDLFSAMIRSWRAQWGQGDFPFYFAQIAPYGYRDANSAFLREAQLQTMQSVENTGMAVLMDIGECSCIHPARKKEVGDRLAYWALANDYGFQNLAFCGPVYSRMEATKDGKINLFFNYAPNGFSSFGRPLDGFEIAGPDKVFRPAEAKIVKGYVSVWSREVAAPQHVRYCFGNCVTGTLFNTAGLPASSFRTDDWAE